MQLASCELIPAAVRRAGRPALPSRRPPWTTTTACAVFGGWKPSTIATTTTTTPPGVICSCASSRRDDAEFSVGGSGSGSGGLVDEGMIVLRRRIHEMRAAETAGWAEPPADWAAWEKEWYGSYDADVCALVGALQTFLMSSRPGVGVGIVAALMLSVPATAFLLLSSLLHASQALLPR
ncbi:hypothetical protein GUJ93_ZPchr0001g31895 [Zizania palustris]|uniref:Uncharacterized protein n=1 Tax=Zizania palustris TaxID=103762 RepID=A0A8J5V136_ZIZPA|nr:hypothetical protein GUJ93_ZPchr0001g31895 [Zizania palustris]